MDNLSPSRLQPVSQGEEKNQDDARPLRKARPVTSPRNTSAPPALDVEADGDDEHHLDERA